MIIYIDIREKDLIERITKTKELIEHFKNIKIVIKSLAIGDIIIFDEINNIEKIIIERKTINDLHASIKDGRYEEQSYRLNNTEHHNHNIIYLIEGYILKNIEKVNISTYSALFSLNYYKGFSVFRSFDLSESSVIILNIAYKIEKEKNRLPFYTNTNIFPVPEKTIEIEENINSLNIDNIINTNTTDKEYITVSKRVKKENINSNNIGEIMLCQIPSISSITAIAILEKYKTINNLIKELEINKECLNNLSYITTKGEKRKISKTSIANIIQYLLQTE